MEITDVGVLGGSQGSDLAVSSDGHWVAAAGPSAVSVWKGDKLIHDIALPGRGRGAIRFSDDTHNLRAGSWSLDLKTGEAIDLVPDGLLVAGIAHNMQDLPRMYSLAACVMSADAARVVVSVAHTPSRGLDDDTDYAGPVGQVVLLEPSAQRLVAVLAADLDAQDVGALWLDGDVAVIASDDLSVYDSRTGDVLVRVSLTTASVASITRGTGPIALGHVDGSISLCGVDDNSSLSTWKGHDGPVRALAIDRRRDLLFSAGRDQQVKVWDVSVAEPEIVGWYWAEESVAGLALHPFGEHLVIAFDGADDVRVLELSD